MGVDFIVSDTRINLAHHLADMTRPVIAAAFHAGLQHVELKQDASPVTDVDRACEQAVREILAREFHDDGVWGEEYGRSKPQAEWQWIIDPIDGTKSFIAGQLGFGFLLALHHCEQGFVLGIADQAIIQTRWAAVKGQGATRNGQVIQTAAHTDINRMRLAITNPTRMTGALRQMHDALANKVEFVQYGGNMMNFARIADGCVHASFETGQHIFDVAPFVTIIGEAGGKITEIDGTPLSLNMKSNHVLAASTQQLHQHLLELYQSF